MRTMRMTMTMTGIEHDGEDTRATMRDECSEAWQGVPVPAQRSRSLTATAHQLAMLEKWAQVCRSQRVGMNRYACACPKRKASETDWNAVRTSVQSRKPDA